MHIEDCWMKELLREEKEKERKRVENDKLTKAKREDEMASKCVQAIQLLIQTDFIVD